MRCLKIKHFVVFITIGIVCSCKPSPFHLLSIEAKLLPITPTIAEVDSIENYVIPYRTRIDEVLDSTLAYAPKTISKNDGTYNASAGNMMADMVLAQAGPIFTSRTGHKIDFVMLNHGGIRAIISKGRVTARTAYEVMPFENSIEVVELSGNSVKKLIHYLINSGLPHPISGMQVILDKADRLKSVQIQGKPFDHSRNYYVATTDYLILGGDQMNFFKHGISITHIDYLLRNALIDYFKKVDTLSPKIDDRFYKMK